MTIRLVRALYFVATKIEAFYGCGQGDFRISHDIEDIVTMVDGRPELLKEIKQEDKALQVYMAEQFKKFLKNDDFLDALPGLLPPDTASQARLPLLMKRLKAIAELRKD